MSPSATTPSSSPSVSVPALGATFHGVSHSLSTADLPVDQYRGIKYAHIPTRFRRSKIVSSYPSHVDATEFGPVCPQLSPVYTTQPTNSCNATALPQDEMECLNLNITCPRQASTESLVPVMVWIHGGAHEGAGSSWLYDGGALVLKGLSTGKPIILVTLNYRLGLFGNASSVAIRDDNKSVGDDGAGNYGLYDQQVALAWVRSHISAFGGDPENITLFGEGTGAADVLCQVHSTANHASPLFARAIAQSPLGAPDEATTVHNAGWQLSRLMSAQGVNDLEAMRALSAEKIASLSAKYSVRAVHDGSFLHPSVLSKSGPVPAPQPLLIGDSSFAPVVHVDALARWTPAQITKRVRVITQSMSQSNALLRAYDVSACTPEPELVERLLELVGDARWAWTTERAARWQKDRPVFRYVWDQETPGEENDQMDAPVDVAYLFDNVPAPESADSPFDLDVFEEDLDDFELEEIESSQASLRSNSTATSSSSFSLWSAPPPVDRYAYAHVRDSVQERWLAFAHGEQPWEEEKVYVFGPEGECGARSRAVFEGRRRTRVWDEALAPLGAELVMKLGVELANGPSL